MAVYAIGDIQGCFTGLCRLLEKLKFDESVDCLWFCGDLVNRGSESLETLRFIKNLGSAAISVLGNHDLHLLALHHSGRSVAKKDTLYAILKSHDRDELMNWLQSQRLFHYDDSLGKAMVHAGIHPDWTIADALGYASEVEQALQGDADADFFKSMYGDKPRRWRDSLSDMKRLRCLTNIFTRMRFFTADGAIEMRSKGSPEQHEHLTPWFELNHRNQDHIDIAFGHWSTLPFGRYGHHFALDGGYVWGGQLVALKIDDGLFEITTVNAAK